MNKGIKVKEVFGEPTRENEISRLPELDWPHSLNIGESKFLLPSKDWKTFFFLVYI